MGGDLIQRASKIKKHWSYLYRTVDSTGATLDFMLSPPRDADAAERFFRQVLQTSHALPARVITVDKNAAYPPAFEALQQERILPDTCLLRQCKALNNVIEQDRRFVKRGVNPGLGFGAFATAELTVQGYEAMHMLRKGQLEELPKGMSLPRTASSTSCSGWPHNKRSPASPHVPMSFCNTTRQRSWHTMASECRPSGVREKGQHPNPLDAPACAPLCPGGEDCTTAASGRR